MQSTRVYIEIQLLLTRSAHNNKRT